MGTGPGLSYKDPTRWIGGTAGHRWQDDVTDEGKGPV